MEIIVDGKGVPYQLKGQLSSSINGNKISDVVLAAAIEEFQEQIAQRRALGHSYSDCEKHKLNIDLREVTHSVIDLEWVDGRPIVTADILKTQPGEALVHTAVMVKAGTKGRFEFVPAGEGKILGDGTITDYKLHRIDIIWLPENLSETISV